MEKTRPKVSTVSKTVQRFSDDSVVHAVPHTGVEANPTGAEANPSGSEANPSGSEANPSSVEANSSGAEASPSGASGPNKANTVPSHKIIYTFGIAGGSLVFAILLAYFVSAVSTGGLSYYDTGYDRRIFYFVLSSFQFVVSIAQIINILQGPNWQVTKHLPSKLKTVGVVFSSLSSGGYLVIVVYSIVMWSCDRAWDIVDLNSFKLQQFSDMCHYVVSGIFFGTCCWWIMTQNRIQLPTNVQSMQTAFFVLISISVLALSGLIVFQLVYIEMKDDFDNNTHYHTNYTCYIEPNSGLASYIGFEKVVERVVYILAIEAVFVQMVQISYLINKQIHLSSSVTTENNDDNKFWLINCLSSLRQIPTRGQEITVVAENDAVDTANELLPNAVPSTSGQSSEQVSEKEIVSEAATEDTIFHNQSSDKEIPEGRQGSGSTTNLLPNGRNTGQCLFGNIREKICNTILLLFCLCAGGFAFARVVTLVFSYISYTGNASSFLTTVYLKIARRTFQMIYPVLSMFLLNWNTNENDAGKAIDRHSSSVEDSMLFGSLFLIWILHGTELFGNALERSVVSSQDVVRIVLVVESVVAIISCTVQYVGIVLFNKLEGKQLYENRWVVNLYLYTTIVANGFTWCAVIIDKQFVSTLKRTDYVYFNETIASLVLMITLPLGVSFFNMHAVICMLDIRGKLKNCNRLVSREEEEVHDLPNA